MEYAVTQLGETEPPFSHPGFPSDAGKFFCVCCSSELFASCERQPSIKDSQKDAALSLLNKLTDQWIGAQSFDSKDDYVGEQLLRLCLLCMDAASTPERAVVEHVDRNNVVMRLTLASVSFELVSGGAAHGSSKRMWTRVA